jgi:ubiquinol-cytochrome c reductase cytochrome c subunit
VSARTVLAAVLALLAAAPAARAQSSTQRPPIVRPVGEYRKGDVRLGAQLFAGNCSSCHGARGQGIPYSRAQAGGSDIVGAGPDLRGVGALAADFYLRTGYMPLGRPGDEPVRARPYFQEREIRALTAYVASLGKGPGIPHPRPQDGNVSTGLQLFTEHCAGCHQVVGEGGVVTGAKVPPLNAATPTQIAQAVRIGPYYMPRFSKKAISDAELNDIVAYVTYAQDPDDAGGWGINHLGPFPEGLVTWLMAVVVLVAVCMVIGRRLKQA